MRPEEIHVLVLARPWAGTPWVRERVTTAIHLGRLGWSEESQARLRTARRMLR